MGIKEGTCEFTPVAPVVYKHKGSDRTAEVIELREPGMEHIKYYLKLKQMVTRCQMELAKQAGEFDKIQESIGEVVKTVPEEAKKLEDDAAMIEEGLSLALLTSESVDIAAFISTFKNMACLPAKKRLCMLNDEVAMTKAIWEIMKPDDAFNMAVKWCSFFAMPSVEGEPITSGQPSELRPGHKEV